jgi:hypothetical protein
MSSAYGTFIHCFLPVSRRNQRVGKGFDPLDQLRRYVRWFREGYLSGTGLQAQGPAPDHRLRLRGQIPGAANLGNDADTTGAVFGQIAGACYGYEGIPAEWRAKIAYRELIESFAGRLYQVPQCMLY